MIRGGNSFAELDAAQAAVADRPWFAAVHRCDQTLFLSARRMVEFDNTAAWQRVRCPVLALYGSDDLSTGEPARPLSVIRQGLVLGGNRDFTERVFAGADHSMRVKDSANHMVFVDGYLDAMTLCVKQRVR